MAKYCENCGKKLDEGKKCDCTKDEPIIHNAHEKSNSEVNDTLDKVISIIKGLLIKPNDTIKNSKNEDNFTISIIIHGIMSIIAGIFVFMFAKVCYSYINLLSLSGYNSSYYNGYSPINSSVNLSLISLFITTVIVAFALSFVFAAILYLVNTKFFGAKANYKEIYSLCGTTSIILSIALLIGLLLMFVSIPLTLIVVVLGLLLNTLYNYDGIKLMGVRDKNKNAYKYVISMMIFLLLAFVLFQILI